ncbi:MAG: tetratricopeptide repeat protein [Lewinellaceae bacterium]|nr:tetratricopeptide repeat protein [Lewinellaceae bacterium]
MRSTLLLLILSMFLHFSAEAQGRPTASNRSSKFSGGGMVMVKKKSDPRDKKMGLGGARRPESFENSGVEEGFNTLDQGNWDEAIDQLDDYSDSDPAAAYGLGVAYHQSGEVEKAIDVLEQSAENTDALYELGLIYAEQGEYDKAEEKFLELLMLDPEDAFAWYELGYLYLETGYYEDAAECFDIVLLIEPSDPDAPYELARIYAISGDVESALAALGQAFQNGFDDLGFVLEDPDLEEVRMTEQFDQLVDDYFQD